MTNLLQALLLNSYFLVLYFLLLGCLWVILIYSIKFIFGNSLVKLHLVFKFLKLIRVVFKSKYENVNLWVPSGSVSVVCFPLAMGYCFLVCLVIVFFFLLQAKYCVWKVLWVISASVWHYLPPERVYFLLLIKDRSISILSETEQSWISLQKYF